MIPQKQINVVPDMAKWKRSQVRNVIWLAFLGGRVQFDVDLICHMKVPSGEKGLTGPELPL